MKLGAIILIFCCFISSAWAEGPAQADPRVINWVTDAWPGITQKDDQGLYDQIFLRVFATQNMTLNKRFAPFKRVLRLIDNGHIDFGGGVLKEANPSKTHIQAPFPVMTNEIYGFGKKHILQNKALAANGYAKLRVCATHMFDEAAGVKGTIYEVHSKAHAFRMTALGRCDLFVDDKLTVLDVVAREKASIENFSDQGFDVQEVGRFSAYMISPRTPRGKEVMSAYVQGTLQALKDGSLEKIYKERGFSIPDELIAYAKGGN